MRISVALSMGCTIYRVAWLNEDTKGVYVGMYGSMRGSHFSYHRDGTCHFKRHDKRQTILQHVKQPIQDIRRHIQVLNQSIPLNDSNMFIVGQSYTTTAKDEAEIFVDGSTAITGSISLDVSLFHRENTADYVRLVYGPNDLANSRKLIAMLIRHLQNFPEHRVGIVLSSPIFRKSETAKT
jgi:hypothetical protein